MAPIIPSQQNTSQQVKVRIIRHGNKLSKAQASWKTLLAPREDQETKIPRLHELSLTSKSSFRTRPHMCASKAGAALFKLGFPDTGTTSMAHATTMTPRYGRSAHPRNGSNLTLTETNSQQTERVCWASWHWAGTTAAFNSRPLNFHKTQEEQRPPLNRFYQHEALQMSSCACWQPCKLPQSSSETSPGSQS